MDDLVLNVRQVYQYALQTTASQGDVVLLQQSGPQGNTAGPYGSMNITDIVKQARQSGGPIGLVSTDFISWSPGPTISFDGTSLNITGAPVVVNQLNAQTISSVGDIFVNGVALADQDWVTALFDSIVESSVWTVNGRKGNVVLGEMDIRAAGGATLNSPRFSGTVIAPTPWNLFEYSDRVATTEWVQNVVACRFKAFNTSDINQLFANSPPGVYPRSVTPPFGDASTRISTTMFVDESIEDLRQWVLTQLQADYATLISPNLVGVPTAPTANPGTSTAQVATTAFVQEAIVASTTGVSHFNGRTGAVTLLGTDIVDAGGAMLVSPIFTGSPQAPTAVAGTSDNTIASCAFVLSEVAASTAGVSSFNGRSGAVTLAASDVTGAGGALLVSPNFVGTPLAPTAAVATNTTQLATCAFVQAVAAANAGVASFNGRQGAVNLMANDISAAGGALIASPIFTGQPAAPTAVPGTSTTQLATTAFVAAAIAAGGTGVTTFNGRAGAVTLTPADVGAAQSPGNRVLIMSQIVPASTPVATVDFLYNFTNQYDLYVVEAYGVTGGTGNGQLGMQFSWDGSTFDASANYAFTVSYAQGTGGGNVGNAGQPYMPIAGGVQGTLAWTNMHEVKLQMPWTTDRYKSIWFQSIGSAPGAWWNEFGSGASNSMQQVRGIRFLMSTGNITRGVFNLYGLVKAGAGAA